MRLALTTTCFTTLATLLAAEARADTTVSSATTTPLVTSSAGNINITSDGSITLSASGAAVTINSNNTVTNAGKISFTGIDNAIGILSTWGMIMICHLLFWRKTQQGELTRPGYRLPGSPWTELVTLAFLASVLVLMYADGGAGRTTVLCLPLIVGALVGGWFGVRRRVGRTSNT